MREYHAFNEVDPSTVAAIIETGFLNLDREILTKQTDRVAAGVVSGILCFANNENIEPLPIPGLTP
jgi:N-acetylmuramoyl-L-alanine amidase